MIKTIKIIMAATLTIYSPVSAQVFSSEGLIYKVRQEGNVMMTKAYNHDYVVVPDTVWNGGKPYIVSEIAAEAFYCLYNLRSVTLPQTLKRISPSTFVRCESLRSIVVMAQEPPACDGDIFNASAPNGVVVSVPQGCKRSYANAKPWSDVGVIVEAQDGKAGARKGVKRRK